MKGIDKQKDFRILDSHYSFMMYLNRWSTNDTLFVCCKQLYTNDVYLFGVNNYVQMMFVCCKQWCTSDICLLVICSTCFLSFFYYVYAIICLLCIIFYFIQHKASTDHHWVFITKQKDIFILTQSSVESKFTFWHENDLLISVTLILAY